MANVFDAASYPVKEPAVLTAGDRWAWTRPDLVGDYPTASYSLSYVARLEGDGATSIAITAGETGGVYVVTVASATTAAYAPGTYHWTSYITRSSDGERYELASGTLVVKPDRVSSTIDPRSWARRALDAVEAYLGDANNLAAASYEIKGRQLQRYALRDLLKLRSELKSEVARERREAALAEGLGSSARIHTRFVS